MAWVEDDDVFALSGSVAASADEKIGGDDAFHHGWDREAWKRRKSREDAIVRTIEETYQRLMGIAPAPAVVAKVRAETPKELRDYTKELEFTQWLSDQIAAELDDEEAILLLI